MTDADDGASCFEPTQRRAEEAAGRLSRPPPPTPPAAAPIGLAFAVAVVTGSPRGRAIEEGADPPTGRGEQESTGLTAGDGVGRNGGVIADTEHYADARDVGLRLGQRV